MQKQANCAVFTSCGQEKIGSHSDTLERERNPMSSRPTLPPLKSGEEPSEVLKVLAFSYIQTLLERGEVEIREVLDAQGKPVDPPVTVVIFSNTNYQHLTDNLEPPESVGNEEKESVGNEEAKPDSVGSL